MNPSDLDLRTRVRFGRGVSAQVGELTGEFGDRVLLVTDPGLVAAGHAGVVERQLTAAGRSVRVFDRVRENPTSSDVAACVSVAGEFAPDVLVALGGGSAIDVAKGCLFVLAGGGTMEDYRGKGTARGTLLPLIAVPTTAGTGSEVQSFALIAQDATHQKMACGDAQAAPRYALLDPVLTCSQPAVVTACTGLDTLGHALESAVCTARNATSDRYSEEAFRLSFGHLRRVLEAPDDLEARGGLLLASCYAGAAIEHSMLGAAHSIANPLSAHHDVPHGLAVGLALPWVIRFNGEESAAAERYDALASSVGLATAGEGTEALARHVEAILAAAGFAGALREYGVTAEAVPALAAEAAQQWTAQFNPRSVDAASFAGLFAAAGAA